MKVGGFFYLDLCCLILNAGYEYDNQNMPGWKGAVTPFHIHSGFPALSM